MSLVGKDIDSSYLDILQVNNSNNGITATHQVKAGDGSTTGLNVAKNLILIKPDDIDTKCFEIQDKSGTTIMEVDSNLDHIKGFGHHLNTQTAMFGITAVNLTANTHTMMGYGSIIKINPITTIGTGTDPDTSITLNTTADDLLVNLMYLQHNITIDQIDCFVAGSGSVTGDDILFHLMSYDIDTGNTATSGDLSGGTVIADHPTALADVDNSAVDYIQLSIASANVDAGKVLIATIHNDASGNNNNASMHIKYHLRS